MIMCSFPIRFSIKVAIKMKLVKLEMSKVDEYGHKMKRFYVTHQVCTGPTSELFSVPRIQQCIMTVLRLYHSKCVNFALVRIHVYCTF